MHRIYTTEALIIDSRTSGEADRLVVMYTKDYGLIRAVAKGLRLEKSKLRYSLTPYAYAEVALVRGREVWRVTSAVHLQKYSEHTDIFRRTILLLKKMSPLETPDRVLFDLLRSYAEYLQSKEPSGIKEAEIAMALSMLNRLGYIGADAVTDPFLNMSFSEEVLADFSAHTGKAIGLINQALRHAHL